MQELNLGNVIDGLKLVIVETEVFKMAKFDGEEYTEGGVDEVWRMVLKTIFSHFHSLMNGSYRLSLTHD